tara:strand:+ start:156 stop:647 length:492 start_codon:yes stop_codon:yes gene_type:complete
MSVEINIRLRSIEQHIRRRHGSDRKPTPNETQIIGAYADTIINYIKRRWPVDTGTSRDRWMYRLLFNVGELVVRLENPMYYSEYVHYAGGTPEDPLWRSLVPEAFQVYKDRLNQDVAQEIDRTERALVARRRQQQTPLTTEQNLMDLIRNPDLVDMFGEVFGG